MDKGFQYELRENVKRFEAIPAQRRQVILSIMENACGVEVKSYTIKDKNAAQNAKLAQMKKDFVSYFEQLSLGEQLIISEMLENVYMSYSAPEKKVVWRKDREEERIADKKSKLI